MVKAGVTQTTNMVMRSSISDLRSLFETSRPVWQNPWRLSTKALQQPPWSMQPAPGQPPLAQLSLQGPSRMTSLPPVGRSPLRQQFYQKVSRPPGSPGHDKGPGATSHHLLMRSQRQMAPSPRPPQRMVEDQRAAPPLNLAHLQRRCLPLKLRYLIHPVICLESQIMYKFVAACGMRCSL